MGALPRRLRGDSSQVMVSDQRSIQGHWAYQTEAGVGDTAKLKETVGKERRFDYLT